MLTDNQIDPGIKFREFLNGPIYWSAATGAHPVVNSFLHRWGVHNYEAGWIGYPTSDEIVLPDGGRRQEFQGAAIYVAFQNAIGSAITNGPLLNKYNTVGGLTPGGTLLGYPIQDQIPVPDGQGQMIRFERGVIYWSPTTDAHIVRAGPILDYWASQGYEAGSLGYPITDELVQNDLGYDYPAQGFQFHTVELYLNLNTVELSQEMSARDGPLPSIFTPSYPNRNIGHRVGTFSAQVSYATSNYNMAWGLQINAALQAKARFGPTTPMGCKTYKLVDGAVRNDEYSDNHPNEQINYHLHSTVPNPEPEGKQYQIVTTCTAANRTNGIMLMQNYFAYEIRQE